MSNKKFHGKFRTQSARAPWWDYGWDGAYYVTVCTPDRIHYFGEVDDDTMTLSEIGKCAELCWQEIPEHFPFVLLGEYVVMPNHVHGIIIIDKKGKHRKVITNGNALPLVVETQDFSSPHPPRVTEETFRTRNRFGPQSKNLGSIIRGFKVGVTTNARLIDGSFAWQSRFHDHIIRDQEEYERISNYIINNPRNLGNG